MNYRRDSGSAVYKWYMFHNSSARLQTTAVPFLRRPTSGDEEGLDEGLQSRSRGADQSAVGLQRGEVPQMITNPVNVPALIQDDDVVDQTDHASDADERAEAEDGTHDVLLCQWDLQVMNDVSREACRDHVRDEGDSGHDRPEDTVVDAAVRLGVPRI